MHMAKMKQCKFIIKKVVECIIKICVEWGGLIPTTHVTHEIDNSIETGNACMVQNTHC
jgi:hypothetical protein